MNRQGKTGYGSALTVLAFLLAMTVTAMAGPNIKEKGVLEAVGEGAKTVTITTQGENVQKAERVHRAVYQLSPLVLVVDGRGRRTTLDAFPLPVKVEFDVEYTPTGAMIKKITVIPQ